MLHPFKTHWASIQPWGCCLSWFRWPGLFCPCDTLCTTNTFSFEDWQSTFHTPHTCGTETHLTFQLFSISSQICVACWVVALVKIKMTTSPSHPLFGLKSSILWFLAWKSTTIKTSPIHSTSTLILEELATVSPFLYEKVYFLNIAEDHL